MSKSIFSEKHFTDETAAYAFIEAHLWPDGPVCPHCGGPIERTLTAPAVQFKGGGWYKDLYSSAKPAASGNGDGGKGESKPGGEASKPAESAKPAASAGSGSGSDSGASTTSPSTAGTTSKS